MSERRDADLVTGPHFQRVVNLSKVLLVLVLLLLGTSVYQHAQIRDMRTVDCAAKQERMSRVMLYDRLIQVWSRSQVVEPEHRDDLVAAYTMQREQVRAAAEAGQQC